MLCSALLLKRKILRTVQTTEILRTVQTTEQALNVIPGPVLVTHTQSKQHKLLCRCAGLCASFVCSGLVMDLRSDLTTCQ